MTGVKRTTVMINEQLLKQALELASEKTARATIEVALQEYVNNHKRKNIFDLAGKIELAEGYDYKAMRIGKEVAI